MRAQEEQKSWNVASFVALPPRYRGVKKQVFEQFEKKRLQNISLSIKRLERCSHFELIYSTKDFEKGMN